jgi:hypothetical protein
MTLLTILWPTLSEDNEQGVIFVLRKYLVLRMCSKL